MSLENRTCFQVNLRDGLRCRVCRRAPLSQQNYHRGFEYHHVRAQSEGGSDETENIVLLCYDCHLRHHQGKLILPHFDDLEMDETFACHACEANLNIETVEMNCGWYRCDECHDKTHLWTHCGFEGSESSTRFDDKDTENKL
ncbi:MAG TPA: HNH endonuclease [Abditibacteriaceae bacterium]|nr:HNH endonuclease [Abditibacteriaceae bacterium]